MLFANETLSILLPNYSALHEIIIQQFTLLHYYKAKILYCIRTVSDIRYPMGKFIILGGRPRRISHEAPASRLVPAMSPDVRDRRVRHMRAEFFRSSTRSERRSSKFRRSNRVTRSPRGIFIFSMRRGY